MGDRATGVGRQFGRWFSGADVGLTFADTDQMAFEFGVDGGQAARRTALILAGDPRLADGRGREEPTGTAARSGHGRRRLRVPIEVRRAGVRHPGSAAGQTTACSHD
jgi:hypothetical protein